MRPTDALKRAAAWTAKALVRLVVWLAWALVGWLSGEMPSSHTEQPPEQPVKLSSKERCSQCAKRPGGRLSKRARDMMPGSEAAKQALGEPLCPDCLVGCLVISGWAYNQADDLTPYWATEQPTEQPTEE